jgi:dihydrolipoamide dehydrogenase
VTALVQFDSTTPTIIDGDKRGFCKLVVDRASSLVLGCHVVGERALDIVQVAAVVIATQMRVNELAHLPLSFPTHSGILVVAAAIAARELKPPVRPQAEQGVHAPR